MTALLAMAVVLLGLGTLWLGGRVRRLEADSHPPMDWWECQRCGAVAAPGQAFRRHQRWHDAQERQLADLQQARDADDRARAAAADVGAFYQRLRAGDGR